MPLQPGRHQLGPADGDLLVRTHRDGLAQRAGHDLVLAARHWDASLAVGEDGACAEVDVRVDPGSLEVVEAFNGVKPLSARDRAEIERNMARRVLHGRPIRFVSAAVETAGGRVRFDGELTIAGATRPVAMELALADGGRLAGTITLVQSEWAIKPYSALMGALRVRDAVEVEIDVRLPSASGGAGPAS